MVTALSSFPNEGQQAALSSVRAAAYTAGRPPYPKAIFEKISKVIGGRGRVLDVGCGNARGTLGLHSVCRFKVVGFDYDPDMIREFQQNCKRAKTPIPIVEGKVKDLATHFPNQRFRAVTAFSACTLFDDDESVKAIRRVLVPGGYFIDAGDEGPRYDPIGVLMREIVKEALNIELKTARQSQEPYEHQALLRNGFRLYKSHQVASIDSYTPAQIMANFKSRLLWPNCSKEQEERVFEAVKNFFKNKVKGEELTFMMTYKVIFYRAISSKL